MTPEKLSVAQDALNEGQSYHSIAKKVDVS